RAVADAFPGNNPLRPSPTVCSGRRRGVRDASIHPHRIPRAAGRAPNVASGHPHDAAIATESAGSSPHDNPDPGTPRHHSHHGTYVVLDVNTSLDMEIATARLQKLWSSER